MSSYYELPHMEATVGSQEELEARFMARIAQEAYRRLRPVRLKIEFESGSESSAASGPSISSAAATTVAATDGNTPALQAVSVQGSDSDVSLNGHASPANHHHHQPTFRRIVSHLPFKHTISRANPFRAVRSLSRKIEGTQDPQDPGADPGSLYEDALLVIGTELLDLHLASDTASDVDDDSPTAGAALAENNEHSFTGPAGLRLSYGKTMRSKAAGSAVLQADLGQQSISALQNSYSLSVSYAQILSVTQSGEEICICYCHNIASRTGGKLHFTLVCNSPQDAANLADDIRQYICRYLQALLLLQNNYRLDAQVTPRLVTLSLPGPLGSDATERVVAHSPAWGTAISLPAPLRVVGSSTVEPRMRVYMSSPIGGVFADITPSLLTTYSKDGAARLWVKAQRQPNASPAGVKKKQACAVQRNDSDTPAQPAEPGMDHDVQLFLSARQSQQPTPHGHSMAMPALLTALALSLLAGLLRALFAQNLYCSAAAGAAPLRCHAPHMCFALSMACMTVYLAVEARSLLQHGGGNAWEVTLSEAAPVHDPHMPEHGQWQEKGKVGEVELRRRAALPSRPSRSPSQESLQVDDRPFGKWTSDEEKRFIEGVNADQKEALRRLHVTAEWRQRMGINNILNEPQPAYHFSKGLYTHGLVCFTKSGQPVWVDKIAELKQHFQEFKASRWTTEDLQRHAAFCEEWLFRVAAPEHFPKGRRLEVVGLAAGELYEVHRVQHPALQQLSMCYLLRVGMSFRDIGAGWFSWIKNLGMLFQEHYPERMSRAFVINAPSSFSMLWKALDPLLTEQVKRKVSVVPAGSSPLALFRQELHEEDILEEWGGSNKMKVYDSKYERQLRSMVQKLNSKQ